MTTPQRQFNNGMPLRVALAVAFILALGLFMFRGPRIGLQRSDDFILIYTPARALLVGANPYDRADIDRVWIESGGEPEYRPSLRHDSALILPLTSLAMLAPFAALPWPAAKYAWVFANLGFLAAVVWLIARMAGFRAREPRTWLFATLALLFMPVHTSFRMGQTPIFVMVLIVAAFAVSSPGRARDEQPRWRKILSGVMHAAASLIKPQIALPFLAFEVLRRRWMTVTAAIIAMVLVALIATLPITFRGVPWWANWQTNLNNFTAGNVGDPTATNPVRHQLLNLHYPLHNFIENRAVVKVTVLVIVGGLALIFFRSWIAELAGVVRARKPLRPIDSTHSNLLLPLSMIAVLTLMIVYHRFYDAVLLLLPLAWAVRELSTRRGDWLGWCVMVLLLPYFANLATVLKTLETRGPLPSWILDQWWWNNLLLPSQSWALLGLAVCFVIAHERARRLHTSA